jgi:hypothetical protein
MDPSEGGGEGFSDCPVPEALIAVTRPEKSCTPVRPPMERFDARSRADCEPAVSPSALKSFAFTVFLNASDRFARRSHSNV